MKLAVLYGGASEEHEVSVSSYQTFQSEMSKSEHEIIDFKIEKNGAWLCLGQEIPISKVIEELQSVDIVFSLLHGTYGEDGTMQGFLETIGVPFVGCGVGSSVIAMDKHLAKMVAQEAGIKVAPYSVVFPHSVVDESVLSETHGLPLFVKPATSGSACGVTKVREVQKIKKAIEAARIYSDKVLVETAIKAREIECSVIGGEEVYVSSLGEVQVHRDFYSYDAKYRDELGATLIVPASLPTSISQTIQLSAKEIFLRISSSGYARVDFFYDGRDVYFNEINTIPGFTDISLFPQMCLHDGLSYTDMIDTLLGVNIFFNPSFS